MRILFFLAALFVCLPGYAGEAACGISLGIRDNAWVDAGMRKDWRLLPPSDGDKVRHPAGSLVGLSKEYDEKPCSWGMRHCRRFVRSFRPGECP